MGDRGEPQEIVATYIMAVSGYPLQAIESAVVRFIRGEVDSHDGRFLPTAAELGREVSRCARLAAPPQAPARQLPPPPREEPDNAARERVRQVAANMKARASLPDARARTGALSEDEMRELFGVRPMSGPLRLSPEALRILNERT